MIKCSHDLWPAKICLTEHKKKNMTETEIKKEEEGEREGRRERIRAKKTTTPPAQGHRDSAQLWSWTPPAGRDPGSAQRRSVEHAAPPGDPHGTGSPTAKQQSTWSSGLWPLLQLMSERVCQDPNISPCPPLSPFLIFSLSSPPPSMGIPEWHYYYDQNRPYKYQTAMMNITAIQRHR